MKRHPKTNKRRRGNQRVGIRSQVSKRGFTLLELLVAVAVLAILSGLIVANLSRAKITAHRIVCMNNLKQWAVATHAWAQENDDLLPREAGVDGINAWEVTGASTNRDVWYNALAESMSMTPMHQYALTPSSQQDFYLDSKIFHCPRARFAPVSATYPNFSLAMNSKLMRDFESAAPTAHAVGSSTRRLGDVKAPDRTALFLDNGIPGEERLSPFQAPYTGQPKASASEFPARHNHGGNIAFVDAHVATLPGKDVVEMDPANVFRGRAIFPPVEVVWRHDPRLVP